MEKIQRISNHVSSSSSSGQFQNLKAGVKSPNDVVICYAKRTALCKAKKGLFKDTPVEDMIAPLISDCLRTTKIKADQIGDLVMGNVLMPGSGVVPVRIASFMGGLPTSVPCQSLNRQCSSGLQAVATVASSIAAGLYDAGMAGGFESMSTGNMAGIVNPSHISENAIKNDGAKNCLIPMGLTSENVAAKFGIDRTTQDKMAVQSHQKACRAQKEGKFDSEIVPVKTKVKDAKGNFQAVFVKKDEGCREETTFESLSKLKPAFTLNGSTTAGNSSQVTDGAALILLARRSFADRFDLPILGKFVSFSAVGVPPEIMGIGPAVAIPAALKAANLKIDEIDIFEVNEAFASQATFCVNTLKIPQEKLNPKGGAIALGHPLGCTGARMIATLLPELKRQGKKLGVVSMCIGGGMGAAGIIESEQ